MHALTPEIILQAYALGVFPMAASRDETEVRWIQPRRRGILPLQDFHISRSLAAHIRRSKWEVRTDTAFRAVMQACAERDETWINDPITEVFVALHDQGHAHSLEVWEGEALVGGVYGLAIGAAFFGESMFSRRSNASKTALAYLTHRLRAGGFQLFDTQFLTSHLASLGAQEISRTEYEKRLTRALALPASFDPPGYCPVSSVVGVSSAAGSSTSGKTRSATSQRSGQTS
jgi:leucyl/phenylalanyl-tRNA---protein transferase